MKRDIFSPGKYLTLCYLDDTEDTQETGRRRQTLDASRRALDTRPTTLDDRPTTPDARKAIKNCYKE